MGRKLCMPRYPGRAARCFQRHHAELHPARRLLWVPAAGATQGFRHNSFGATTPRTTSGGAPIGEIADGMPGRMEPAQARQGLGSCAAAAALPPLLNTAH